MKKSVAIIMVLLICVSGIPAPVSADTGESKTYSSHSDVVYDATTGEVSVTTEVTLSSSSGDEKTNWELDWYLPSNAEIEVVSAENGSVHFTKDYTRVDIQRDSGKPTASETFTIKYTYEKDPSSTTGPVERTVFSFINHKKKWSSDSVEFTVKNGTLDGVLYSTEFTRENESTVSIDSRVGISFYALTTPASAPEPFVETDDYVVYGEPNLSKSEIKGAYQTAKTVTGKEPDSKIPVVFVGSQTKGSNEVDAGKYWQGIAFVRTSDESAREYTTLAHEFQHAYDDRLIGYVPLWFAEGTAQLTESRAKLSTGDSQPSVKHSSKINSIDSNTSIETITDFQDDARFSYYYTELLMKEFVKSEGLDAYQSAYETLSENKTGLRVVETSDISSAGFPVTTVCTDSNTNECVESTMNTVPAQETDIAGSAPSVSTTTEETPTSESTPATTQATPEQSSESNDSGVSPMFITQIFLPVVALLVVVFLRIR